MVGKPWKFLIQMELLIHFFLLLTGSSLLSNANELCKTERGGQILCRSHYVGISFIWLGWSHAVFGLVGYMLSRVLLNYYPYLVLPLVTCMLYTFHSQGMAALQPDNYVPSWYYRVWTWSNSHECPEVSKMEWKINHWWKYYFNSKVGVKIAKYF